MKKILITGANSFIGCSFENYINERFPDRYEVDTVDTVDPAWREKSFAGYDAVFHVAGIAHADVRRVDQETKKKYYAVNTDLAVETAKKAKADGAGQFIFMSSAIVYGDSAPIGKTKRIGRDTPPSPANFYGDSKLQAENGLRPLEDGGFKVVVLRPPMIYGPGCKGNYPLLAKFAVKLPFFPRIKNERSMLYVGNLVEFVRLMIENGESGTFMPQNGEFVSTFEMVRMIAAAHGKKVRGMRGTGPALRLLSHFTGLVNKAFGSLAYDPEASEYKEDYRLFTLEESVRLTEEAKR